MLWGKSPDKYRDMEVIQRFFCADTTEHWHTLSLQTLKDIDIESLFEVIDRTNTSAGQQFLFNILMHPVNDQSLLEQRKTAALWLSEKKEQRLQIQYELSRMEERGTGKIALFFNGTLAPPADNVRFWITLLSWIACIGFLLSFLIKGLIFWLLPVFFMNIIVQYILRHKYDYLYSAMNEVFGFIKGIRAIAAINNLPVDKTQVLSSAGKLKKFTQWHSVLNFGIPNDDLSRVLFHTAELLKGIFLLEFHLLRKCLSTLTANTESLRHIFVYIGQIETAMNIASLLEDNNLTTCFPVFSNSKSIFHCEDIIHPLVTKCTPNSLYSKEESILLTGSNMSGKSTFLRAMLINSIMAQTLNTCFAGTFTTSFFRALSSIKIADSLTAGRSYYFEEVKVMQQMVNNAQQKEDGLYIIDEICKGTNTAERIGISVAILRYMQESGVTVIASSHDVELVSMLNDIYTMYHFSEVIQDGQLFFDYTIKAGPVSSSNAIKILTIENFPGTIVANAAIIAEQVKQNGRSV